MVGTYQVWENNEQKTIKSKENKKRRKLKHKKRKINGLKGYNNQERAEVYNCWE